MIFFPRPIYSVGAEAEVKAEAALWEMVFAVRDREFEFTAYGVTTCLKFAMVPTISLQIVFCISSSCEVGHEGHG